MQVDRRFPICQQQRDVVIHSLTVNILQFKHYNSSVHFCLCGANVFTLVSNEHYFRSRIRALPQDSHSLRESTRDLWTVFCFRWHSSYNENINLKSDYRLSSQGKWSANGKTRTVPDHSITLKLLCRRTSLYWTARSYGYKMLRL
jgi:hypothetical protein